MTTTYDPFHPRYFDEADLREEMTRIYDICHGCRLCFKYCTAFPSLFDFIDRHDDQDAARGIVGRDRPGRGPEATGRGRTGGRSRRGDGDCSPRSGSRRAGRAAPPQRVRKPDVRTVRFSYGRTALF